MTPMKSSTTFETIYQCCHKYCCCCLSSGRRLIAIDPTPQQQQHNKKKNDNEAKKTIQVYILLGQSNMVGMGHVEGMDREGTLEHAVWRKGLYPYLVDEKKGEGKWATSSCVRYVHIQGNGGANNQGKVLYNDWMSIKGCKTIGPEFGIVNELIKGRHEDEPILIIKSCIGNRALGWDLLPPGSKEFEYVDEKGVTWVYAGYGDTPDRWMKGQKPKPSTGGGGGWYAGIQYEGDIARAKHVLEHLADYYPDGDDYEVAGFFFWQGDRDSHSDALSQRYEINLAQFIRQLRVDCKADEAYFCCASLGQTKIDDTDNGGKILMAELRVEKYPEFEGGVASVYSHPYCKGGTSGGHYDGNAETYMDVGQAMGRAMVNLQRLK